MMELYPFELFVGIPNLSSLSPWIESECWEIVIVFSTSSSNTVVNARLGTDLAALANNEDPVYFRGS